MRKIFEWLWSLLPDKCEGEDCCRRGILGNENIIDGKILCDYCSAKSWDDRVRSQSTTEETST